MNVIGVACALAGNIVVQISLPVSLSKARKRLSLVAPINTTPPAVTSDPPKFEVPVGGIPLASNSSTTPSTERQRKSPVSRLIAVRKPHGGFWQGLRSLSQKRELGLPIPRLRNGMTDPSGRGTMRNSIPTSMEFTYSVRASGSYGAPPQFAPPLVPGNSTVGFKPIGVKMSPNTAPSTSLLQ